MFLFNVATDDLEDGMAEDQAGPGPVEEDATDDLAAAGLVEETPGDEIPFLPSTPTSDGERGLFDLEMSPVIDRSALAAAGGRFLDARVNHQRGRGQRAESLSYWRQSNVLDRGM